MKEKRYRIFYPDGTYWIVSARSIPLAFQIAKQREIDDFEEWGDPVETPTGKIEVEVYNRKTRYSWVQVGGPAEL